MSNIFGKSGAEKRLKRFRPSGFTTPGGIGRFEQQFRTNKKGKRKKDGFDFVLERSSGLNQNLDALQTRLGERAAEFRGLRNRVSGTVGEFTRARIDAIRRAGSRTVGNLREELGQRRVLGSSFGQDQITRTEAEFAAQEAEQAAAGKLTEFGLEAEFLNEEFASSIQGLQTLIEQSNFETSLSASVATAGSAQIQANLQAQVAAANARRAGWAELATTLVGLGMPGGGSTGSTGGSKASDVALKQNIQLLARIAGFNWYTWQWNALAHLIGCANEPCVGVLAQEVQRIRPDAVTRVSGYLHVDYGKLPGVNRG